MRPEGEAIGVEDVDAAAPDTQQAVDRAPHVAGMLARMVGAHPAITCWQAKTVLAQIADNRD